MSTITAPDGGKLTVFEILAHALRSAFVISQRLPESFDLFSASRAMPIYGDPLKFLTTAHCNMSRSSGTGLPQGWEFFASSWRAKVNQPQSEPLLEWATDVSVEFIYNMKPYGQVSLCDLIHGQCTLSNYESFGRQIGANEDLAAVMKLLQTGTPGLLPHGLPANWLPVWMRPQRAFGLRIDRSGASPSLFGELTQGRRHVVWLYLEGILKRDLQ